MVFMNFFQKIRLPRYSVLLFTVFFVVSSMSLYEFFREYTADAKLIVIAKSPSISAENAANNIAEIPKMLTFYDQLLENHPEISDPWVDEDDVSRKKHWSTVIVSEVIPGTSIVHLSVSAETAMQSKAFLNASLETLYGFSGRLYDRNNNVDIRLIEDVIVNVSLPHKQWFFILSFLLSVSFTFVILRWLRFLNRKNVATEYLMKHAFFSQMLNQTESLRPVGSFSETASETSSQKNIQRLNAEVSESSFFTDASNALGKKVYERDTPREEKDVFLRRDALSIKSSVDRLGSSSIISLQREESSLLQGNQDIASPIVREGLATIPVDDFSWDRIFSHNNEGVVKADTSTIEASSVPATDSGQSVNINDTVEAKKSEVVFATETPIEKREPTPEELKKRLNELLTGSR